MQLLNCCRQEGARIPPADKDGGNSLFGIEYNRNTVSMFNYQGPAKVPTTLLPYGLVDFAWSRGVSPTIHRITARRAAGAGLDLSLKPGKCDNLDIQFKKSQKRKG